MNEIKNLIDRLDVETARQEDKRRRLQQERLETFEKRKRRYKDLFAPAWDRLQNIWLPRMRLLTDRFRELAEKFGESVSSVSEIRPTQAEPHSGATTFTFESSLATIQAGFSFFHDSEVRVLVLDYELRIIPVFLEFEPHSRLQQGVEIVDVGLIASWLDDRIVGLVRTYLALHDNPTYVSDQLVEDPIARISFPKDTAAATLQKEGITYYFLSDETKREFQDGCDHTRIASGQEIPCESAGP